jgi:hypothetical protein
MPPAKGKKPGKRKEKGKEKGKEKDSKVQGVPLLEEGSEQGQREQGDPSELRRQVQKAYRDALANEGKLPTTLAECPLVLSRKE